ncbi:MAG: N-acetyltransferase [Spirosoma sp.]|nr:N-acetyltransferase [Spirosoma sp.]
MTHVSIIPYHPRYQPDFKRLNIAWIEKYFQVEPHDLEQLDQPQTFILPNKGQIFFAVADGEVVGCVAMVNTGTAPVPALAALAGNRGTPERVRPDGGCTGFELAKMAVSPTMQGQGIGKKLCLAALDYARQLGASTVWLESNRILTPALTLYEQVGFREVPRVETPYARANIRMEITL